MSWGISERASEKEKIKSQWADELKGYNSCCKISYEIYSELFEIGMELLEKMYEQGRKDLSKGEINNEV